EEQLATRAQLTQTGLTGAAFVGAELAEAVRDDEEARASALYEPLELDEHLIGVREECGDLGGRGQSVEVGVARPSEHGLASGIDQPDLARVAVSDEVLDEPLRPGDAALGGPDDRESARAHHCSIP